MTSTIEWRQASPSLEDGLTRFFSTIDAHDRHFFCPHAFDADQAKVIAHYQGQDIYGVLTDGETVLAYGMLRGWDEGFVIPSLGILVAHQARGSGIAQLVMRILHAAARRRGAKTVRLRVNDDNARAIALYKSVGYEFTEMEGSHLIGFVGL